MSERKADAIYSAASAAARLMLAIVGIPMAIWQGIEVGTPAAIEMFAIFGGCAVVIWLIGYGIAYIVANYYPD